MEKTKDVFTTAAKQHVSTVVLNTVHLQFFDLLQNRSDTFTAAKKNTLYLCCRSNMYSFSSSVLVFVTGFC